MGDDNKSLTVDQVKQYLTEHPDFLLTNPDILEAIELHASPEGTISLAQRQVQKLQEKNSHLHEQLSALLETAHANTDLQQRVHELCLKLLDTTSFESLLNLLVSELKQEFSADEVALRLFYSGDKPLVLPKMKGNIQQIHADDNSLRVFDNLFTKQQPVCGRLTKAQKQVLFNEHADSIQSVACLPLGHEPCAGLLAIASEDANRFHADMGTTYLTFLGEIFMRLLRQYCHNHDGQV